jgi:hypothetical protein
MADHVYVTPETCKASHDQPGCMVCDGGLGICSICGLVEGSLTTDCPGFEAYADYADYIYAGKIDFRNGQWVNECSPHTPAYYRRKEKQPMDNQNPNLNEQELWDNVETRFSTPEPPFSTLDVSEYPDPFTNEDRQRWDEQEQASMAEEPDESVSQMMRAEIQQ